MILKSCRKLYVIKNNGKYYTIKERWTKYLTKAWLFSNKKVHGFNIKDFPAGTKIVPVIWRLTEEIKEKLNG